MKGSTSWYSVYFMLNKVVDERYNGRKKPVGFRGRQKYEGYATNTRNNTYIAATTVLLPLVNYTVIRKAKKKTIDLFVFKLPRGVQAIPPTIHGILHTIYKIIHTSCTSWSSDDVIYTQPPQDKVRTNPEMNTVVASVGRVE